MRTLIGGVGQRDSGDHAIGALVSDRLATDAPINAARVVVEDLSADPIEVAERLNGEWPKFERVIFVAAVARARPAGTIAAYRWDGDVSNDDGEQERDGDLRSAADHDLAAFDSLLLSVKRLADLPDETIVVEVEPDSTGSHHVDSLGPAGTAALERVRTLVRRLATNARAAADLPRRALGGGARENRAD
ncbi:MAG: hypothetical protein ACREOG_05610 [Gemmatimonadaceae bacterium]